MTLQQNLINIENKLNGDTFLLLAMRNKRYDIVEFLLKNGANVNYENKNFVIPLNEAAGKKNFLKFIKLLCK